MSVWERAVSDQNVLNSLPGTIIQLLHSIRTSVIRRSQDKDDHRGSGGESVFHKDEGQITGMQKTNEVWHSEKGKKKKKSNIFQTEVADFAE